MSAKESPNAAAATHRTTKHNFLTSDVCEQVVRECGSFSSYIWSFVNHKPIINKYKYPRSVPIRSPKAEALSKDMVKRGFRFVGPVIVHSFMQAAGLTLDHLVDCYRHSECVSLAERPWRHI
ncbi:hypothetical protein TSUD_154120 [Trifolium subterraneum]|uniref:Uncharacterized protein n=1 Tax=Trifolium subterraneum TaxID=3900 RepID=A0A2Z6NQ93_TRISU|nr:hypothetical protein TSUD_154120 [Trifolium subterraneum]